ncbi:hypothetical protein NDU88_001391 [Pleurodeles waltl]|uniref:Uncharacterized protein n=1 Tax=Pleurodeles waltl TaxID=8319 RepID=A0AAV7WLT7_PLEWA|nr:hypothetical protein NDU88_001391 [Pleurodeles waltl]
MHRQRSDDRYNLFGGNVGARSQAGAPCPAFPHLRYPTCGSTLLKLRPCATVQNHSVRSLQPGKLEPGFYERHSCAQAAAHLYDGRNASQSRARRPVAAVPWGGSLVAVPENAHLCCGPRAQIRLRIGCLCAPVLCATSRSLSLLEAKSAYGAGRCPSRPWAADTGSPSRWLSLASMGSSSAQLEAAASVGGPGRRGGRRLPREELEAPQTG